MMKLNISTGEMVKHTNRLEKLHKSALPNAIRSTLNSAAFDVKQHTMPAKSQQEFINRQPNFFKANSRVDMAKGWDVNSMKATVGFTEQGLKGGNNYAVKDLEQQEHGGVIKGKSFIPTDAARGGSGARPVRPTNRLSQINNVVTAKKGSGNWRKKFLAAVYKAGVGGHVIGGEKTQVLWRIDSLGRKKGGKLDLKMTPLYTFKEGRSVRVKATGFMQEASLESADKMERFYKIEAEKQVKRLAQ
jgi:hypothetical protein